MELNGFEKGDFKEYCKEYIVYCDSQSGKNSTLYKTHKPDTPGNVNCWVRHSQQELIKIYRPFVYLEH